MLLEHSHSSKSCNAPEMTKKSNLDHYLELLHIVEQEFGLPWLKKQVKNEHGIYYLHRFPTFTLNRLKHAQLDHTVVAQVRSY